MEVNKDTKFPEPTWDTFLIRPQDYIYVEVQDWFKRCIEDYPYAGPSAKIHYDRYDWFKRWFSQFNKKSE